MKFTLYTTNLFLPQHFLDYACLVLIASNGLLDDCRNQMTHTQFVNVVPFERYFDPDTYKDLYEIPEPESEHTDSKIQKTIQMKRLIVRKERKKKKNTPVLTFSMHNCACFAAIAIRVAWVRG